MMEKNKNKKVPFSRICVTNGTFLLSSYEEQLAANRIQTGMVSSFIRIKQLHQIQLAPKLLKSQHFLFFSIPSRPRLSIQHHLRDVVRNFLGASIIYLQKHCVKLLTILDIHIKRPLSQTIGFNIY